ncbi:MAG: hypothetical protein ACM3JB_22735, partial [Acidobacteriaceae bacterium]
RIAEFVDNSRRNIRDFEPPSVSHDELAKHMAATYDIPIHLETLIIYLRIFADCLANVVPYFYGPKRKTIPSDSFRAQRNWFLKRRPNFDSEYSAILKEGSRWFNVLAGDPPNYVGLRDAVIHYRGGIQLMFRPQGSHPAKVIAMLYSDYRTLTGDLIVTLEKLFRDLCVFLDGFVQHFAHKVNHETQSVLFDPSDSRSLLWFQYEDDLPSDWLYPEIDKSQG